MYPLHFVLVVLGPRVLVAPTIADLGSRYCSIRERISHLFCLDLLLFFFFKYISNLTIRHFLGSAISIDISDIYRYGYSSLG